MSLYIGASDMVLAWTIVLRMPKLASMHGEKPNMTLMSVVYLRATISALGSSAISLIYLIDNYLRT